MLSGLLLPLILLVPLVALGLAYVAWQIELWPLAVVLAAYAAIWLRGVVAAGSGRGPAALLWGGFFVRYFLMVGLGTVSAILTPGRRLAWLGWLAVFGIALVLRDQVNDVAALLTIAAYVVVLSWRPVEGRMTWGREGGSIERAEVPEAVAAMLGLATHPMLTASLVIGHAVVGLSLLPNVDAFDGWPSGLGEGGAFLLAITTGAFAQALITSVFAGDATQRMIDTLRNQTQR